MNDEVSAIRQVAQSIAHQIGAQDRHHLGTISDRDAARFHLTIQGAVPGPDREQAGTHPLMPSAVLAWGDGPPEDELIADGNVKDIFGGVELGGLRLMGGGQDLVFHQPVAPGTELWMDVQVEDIQLKQGRSGEFITLRLLREFRDAAGTTYTTCHETFLAR
ncbi:FAS1-like dehydratase domain-containing protein [Cryobacterium aureum]|uniref:FAS1-like dehydratase domain-containing protein n=1 Tax=Cryobacterium aureum TaxID=995037 RepID=UPI000CF4E2FE|nr:MaoC family dehydratase N-terminal domain-containing protein [Cryobacterium aureum]